MMVFVSAMEEIPEILFLGLLALLIVAFLFCWSLDMMARSHEMVQCLEAGYPAAQRVDGQTFCLRQVNGTDDVVPLDRLLKVTGGH